MSEYECECVCVCVIIHILSVAVDCGTLPNPDFGRVVITTTKFAGAAKYSCNDGFMLVGVALRRCTAGGVWSGEAPICKGICMTP